MFTLKRQNRLISSVDFRRVFSFGKKKHLSGITLITYTNAKKEPRIGFAISKKQIKNAVDRNKLKRIAKERFRLQQKELRGLDFIIMVHKPCQDLNNAQLSQYFQQLFITSAKLFEIS